MAHVEQVAERDQRHADDGEDGLLDAMLDAGVYLVVRSSAMRA